MKSKKVRILVNFGHLCIRPILKTTEEVGGGRGLVAMLVLVLLLDAAPAWSVPVDLTSSPVHAHNNEVCLGDRNSGTLGCTAKEFTVNPVFSAAPGTPPFCVAGNAFSFLVDLEFSGSNTDRYDISFYTGQENNSPSVVYDIPADYSSTPLCSVAAFPLSLAAPWGDFDGSSNICADYAGRGESITRVDQLAVNCQADPTLGYLSIPFTLAYDQNTGNANCDPTDPSTYPIPTSSKCVSGTSTVSGTVKVYAGAYVDVIKETVPSSAQSGDNPAFTLSAYADSSSALVSSGTVNSDGTYDNVSAAVTTSASGSPGPISTTISDGDTDRFFVNLPSGTSQNLHITEATPVHWEPTATAIECTTVTGSPTLNPSSPTTGIQTIAVSNLSEINVAAACTITNYKRSRITLVKEVAGRVNLTDQFQVQAAIAGGDTNPLTDDAGTTIGSPVSASTSGSETSASNVFWSTPKVGATGHTLTFTDSATSGSLSDYTTTYACSNGLAGSSTTMPSGSGTTFDLTPEPGDDITCTFTNQAKPTLTKAFVKAVIGVEMPTILTYTITNPAGAVARTSLSFTDDLPAGSSSGQLVVAASPNLATSGCGASPSITADAGATSLVATSFELAAGASTCTINVDLASGTVDRYTNGSANITAISGHLLNGVTDQTVEVQEVTLTKSYSPDEIFETGASTLTFTLTNGEDAPAQANLTFTDTLDLGSDLTVTGVTALSGTNCSSTTPTYKATGDPSVTLTNASMSAGATVCTFTVTVRGDAEGAYANTAANLSGAGLPINASSLDSTLVVSRLGVDKVFLPDTVDIYETSNMTFTLTNTSATTGVTDVTFSDTFPASLFVRSPASITGTCGGVTNNPALTVGATALDLTIPSLAANSSCTIIIPVSATASGSYDNTTEVVTATGTGGAPGTSSNTATLTVNFLPLWVTKVASGSSVNPGGTITYTIAFGNPNAATPLTNVVITDPIPEYTTFQSASCATPLPATITACNISAPAVGATGTVTWTLIGDLNAGSSGQVYLSVKVN